MGSEIIAYDGSFPAVITHLEHNSGRVFCSYSGFSEGMSCIKEFRSTFLVVGGGIAGVSCAQQLSRSCSDETVILVTATDLVKVACNLKQFGRNLEEFDVEEKSFSFLSVENPNVTVVRAVVTAFDPEGHFVVTASGDKIFYEKLCICTGGKPNVITSNPDVIGIRDTDSVKQFQARLSIARRVVLVGNGGIALELAFEMSGCEVVWAVKDDAIGNTFFDKGAAAFFLPQIEASVTCSKSSEMFMELPSKRMKYGIVGTEGGSQECASSGSSQALFGGALGPDWSSGLSLSGARSSVKGQRRVHVEFKCEVRQLLKPEEFAASGVKDTSFPCAVGIAASSSDCGKWPRYVQLTNGKIYGCDLIISATGVNPNTEPFTSSAPFEIADDGGFKVDSNFHTNIKDVFAAGDACTASWDPSPHWFQMRLWSQARQMGAFAARCMMANMVNEQLDQDFAFELFAHVTQFFGYKVVLLGRYNGQGMANNYELLVRCTRGDEYVKVVLHGGKMCGALLVGETDLEETFENLILNGMDLSTMKDILLDPDIDIEDYFD